MLKQNQHKIKKNCVDLVGENYHLIGQKSGVGVVNAEKAEILFFPYHG